MKRYKAAAALLLAMSLLPASALAEGEELDRGDNAPPVAENQMLETYRGVSVGGQLKAHDPDGDQVTFEITTEPMKGEVALSADGAFVYTPGENRRGKDYFGFRAVDAQGNPSQEGTVIIRLLRQKSKLTYADMTGSGAEYAAVVLTERGVFTGETVGRDHIFDPEGTVTRGEFLTMCMTAAGCPLLQSVRSTGFRDDGDIGGWLKPYVATALMRGYIRGVADENGARFCPGDGISLRDACSMLNAVLGVTDVVSAGAFPGEELSESAQAAANLTACGVLPAWSRAPEETLTRWEAAELLQNAIRLMDRR